MYFVNFGFIIFNKLQQKKTKKQTSEFTNFGLHKLQI